VKAITPWASAAILVLATASFATCAFAEGGVELIMKGVDGTAAPNLNWTEPKSIPPGTKMLMIYGSPDKPGPYVFRVRFPAGYKLPPHKHPDQRQVTVLTGSYWTAVGEKFEQDKLKKFGARDFYVTDAGVPHFSWAETDVVIQEAGVGPVSDPIEYVDKADDPRK